MSYNRETNQLGMNDKHSFSSGIYIEGQWLDGRLIKILRNLSTSDDDDGGGGGGGGGSIVGSIFGFVGGAAGVISTAISGVTSFKALASLDALDTITSLMQGNFQDVFSRLDSLGSKIPQLTQDLAEVSLSLGDLENIVTDHGVKLQQTSQVLDSIMIGNNGNLYNSSAFLESAFNNNFSVQNLVNYVTNTPQTLAYGETTTPAPQPTMLSRSNMSSDATRYWLDGHEIAKYSIDEAVTQKLTLKQYNITSTGSIETIASKSWGIEELEQLEDKYTKDEVDNKLANVYTKTQIDATHYTKNTIDTTLTSYYTKANIDANTYTKTQVDNKLATIPYFDTSLYYTKANIDTTVNNINANQNKFLSSMFITNSREITQAMLIKLYTLLSINRLDNQTFALLDSNGYSNSLSGDLVYRLNSIPTYNHSGFQKVLCIDDNNMFGWRSDHIQSNGTELTIGTSSTTKVKIPTVHNNNNATLDTFKPVMISSNGELATITSGTVTPATNVFTRKYSSSNGWYQTNKMAGVHKAENFLVVIDHDWALYNTKNKFMFCIPYESSGYTPYYTMSLHLENSNVNIYATTVSTHVSKPTYWTDTSTNKSYHVFRCYIKSDASMNINGYNLVFKCILLPNTLTTSAYEFNGIGTYTKDAPF